MSKPASRICAVARAIASSRTASSRITPRLRETSSRPASNCGFTSASNVPPDALHKTYDEIYAGFYALAAPYSADE